MSNNPEPHWAHEAHDGVIQAVEQHEVVSDAVIFVPGQYSVEAHMSPFCWAHVPGMMSAATENVIA